MLEENFTFGEKYTVDKEFAHCSLFTGIELEHQVFLINDNGIAEEVKPDRFVAPEVFDAIPIEKMQQADIDRVNAWYVIEISQRELI